MSPVWWQCAHCQEVLHSDLILGWVATLLSCGLAYGTLSGEDEVLCLACQQAARRKGSRRLKAVASNQEHVLEPEAIRELLHGAADRHVDSNEPVAPGADIAPRLDDPVITRHLAHVSFMRDTAEVMDMLYRMMQDCQAENADTAEVATLLKDLRNSPELQAPQLNRVYSPKPRCFGQRGGLPYFKPNGWSYIGLNVDKRTAIKDWAVAYHGTCNIAAAGILQTGLCRPGDHVVEQEHGVVGACGARVICVSKSVCMAAHPVNSALFRLDDRLVQLVFKCRVKPGSFRSRGSTLDDNHWDPKLTIDPNYPDNSDMEWLVESEADVRVTGILLREFGPNSDPSKYGDLVLKVREPFGQKDPERTWTELLEQHRRDCGDFME